MNIGITGGYRTGKTSAAQVFRKKGAGIIDLDEEAHATLLPSGECYKKVIRAFGSDILVNGRISHQLLAYKVFGNKKKLSRLDSIMHPVVIRRMRQRITALRRRYKMVVVEAPLLFEAGLEKYFDYIIVVAASRKNQITRAMRTTGCSRADALKRIGSQWPLSRKCARADFIIDTDTSKLVTRRKVSRIITQLQNKES